MGTMLCQGHGSLIPRPNTAKQFGLRILKNTNIFVKIKRAKLQHSNASLTSLKTLQKLAKPILTKTPRNIMFI